MRSIGQFIDLLDQQVFMQGAATTPKMETGIDRVVMCDPRLNKSTNFLYLKSTQNGFIINQFG